MILKQLVCLSMICKPIIELALLPEQEQVAILLLHFLAEEHDKCF